MDTASVVTVPEVGDAGLGSPLSTQPAWSLRQEGRGEVRVLSEHILGWKS